MEKNQAIIRAAKPEEGPLLSELALRSKGYWDYDSEFLEACRASLTVTPEYISSCTTYLIEEQGQVRGFYGLRALEKRAAELTYLFIAPEAIGNGYGKGLWSHMVAIARQGGFERVLIESDPNAEPFYLARGARRIGEAPSEVLPDRMLPLLEFSMK